MLDLQNPDIWRAALESLQTGVCLMDLDRKIHFWNDGAERLTGYLRQDVLGRSCRDIGLIKFHENKVAVCDETCPVLAAMRDGKPRESRAYIHHKSGYAVPVSLRAVPIRDAHGHVVGAVESFSERPWVSKRRRPGSDLLVGHGLDAVTHLPDCPFTGSHLGDRLKYAAEHNIPFGLLCIQLDHFDTLKATHGLDAAETILNVVAHTLRNGLDPQDFVGRWSEDQFLAILGNCTNHDVLTTAERLKRLSQSSEVAWWGDQLSVTVSVGGTISHPGEPMESLLQRTGAALSQAVANGGNCASVLYAAEMPGPKER
ncbi:MAG TPA: diguanylate cyclase [Terriglobia bacterium]|nr:diguanylate cyclase [Terriglobia bacterium]